MQTFSSTDQVREYLRKWFESNPVLHIDVSLKQPRLQLSNVEVVITGVYAHVFRIEERAPGVNRSHTMQYTDVLLHALDILDPN